jgi:hypothetical protein
MSHPTLVQGAFSEYQATPDRNSSRQKFTTILAGNKPPAIRRANMRTSSAILLGSIAAFAVLTAPVLAKTSNTQPTDTASTSSQCYSSEQNADGSWTQLPCQELGTQAQTPRKSAARSVEETTH